jgi:hypothetical protein
MAYAQGAEFCNPETANHCEARSEAFLIVSQRDRPPREEGLHHGFVNGADQGASGALKEGQE